MIPLTEAVDLLLGDSDDPPRRALLLGAGFSKATAPWAPLFGDYAAPLRRALIDAGDRWMAEHENDWLDVPDLVERVDRHLGRAAVARVLLSEPQVDPRQGTMQLAPGQPLSARAVPPQQPRTFATLREWRDLVEAHSPTHLKPLYPDAPNLLVARLVAEGVIEELLSTNWDALVELGAMLSGLCVDDAEEAVGAPDAWWRGLPGRLRVFDTQDQIVTRWLREQTPALYKLHGGVRTMRRVLAQGPTDERDMMLRRSFLVSATDLLRWQGSARWVEERAPATLRSCATMFIGVSGADPVVYHAAREQIRDWEEATGRSAGRCEAHAPLRLVAVDRDPKLRLLNLMSARMPDGQLWEPVAASDGDLAAHALYSQWLLQQMERAGLGAPDLQMLRLAFGRELNSPMDGGHFPPPGPISQALCLSLGFGARFAAAAVGAGPFAVRALAAEPFRRWWYAPWRGAPGLAPVLRAAGTLLAKLAEMPGGVAVDRWTGAITVDAAHPLLDHLGLGHDQNAVLLLLPAPWGPPDLEALARELGPRMAYGPGQSIEGLGDAPLGLIPIGFAPPGTDRPSPFVAGVPARWLTFRSST